MKKLSGQIEALLLTLSDIAEEQKKEKLKKYASLILKTFEEELDISPE